jgi:hypothetical protein
MRRDIAAVVSACRALRPFCNEGLAELNGDFGGAKSAPADARQHEIQVQCSHRVRTNDSPFGASQTKRLQIRRADTRTRTGDPFITS